MTILVITYHSGLMAYIPKDDAALNFILCQFTHILDIVEVKHAELGVVFVDAEKN